MIYSDTNSNEINTDCQIKEYADMYSELSKLMTACTLCPRNCGANRYKNQVGYCGQTDKLFAARAALHFWEEPCISGSTGSGAVFFSGCNMRCVFCQNRDIAEGNRGKEITIERLCDIFLELEKKGATNINLVTPTHFIPQIAIALKLAKNKGLSIPILYNTSSYEKVESLKLLEGLVDIYLPDFKYFSSDLAAKYSHASDYCETAQAAIAEMFRQVGKPILDEKTGLMKKGIIIRHLILPGQARNAKKILRYLHNTYQNDIYVSIMNQYTPLPHVKDIPELNCLVSDSEYQRIILFAEEIGIINGFIQEGSSASESFIPSFDFEGIL